MTEEQLEREIARAKRRRAELIAAGKPTVTPEAELAWLQHELEHVRDGTQSVEMDERFGF